MKKQKQHSQSEAPIVSSNGELAFMINTSSKQLGEISKQIGGAILRAKGEAKLILASTETLVFTNYKELEELHVKGRCTAIDINTDLTESQLEGIKHVCIIDDLNTNIAQLASTYISNRKEFQLNKVQIGTFSKASGKLELPFATKLKKWVFNFLAQLFLPLPLKDYTHSFVYFPIDSIQRYYNFLYYSKLSLLCKCAYEEYAFSSFTLTQKENNPSFSGLGDVFKTTFFSRLNWFIRETFSKQKTVSLAGNAPFIRTIFVVVVLLTLLLMPMLSLDYGITWDAKRHNLYGYDMLKYFDTDGEDKTALSETSSMQEFRYYGEHFNVIAAWLNTYIKAWDEFETRHILNSLYGFLTILFAAFIAKEIANWRAALLAFLMMLLSPVFFGHSMNNPTDIPFAAGCAMALYFLIKVLRHLPSPKFTYVLWCGAGIGMAIGARIGGVVLYAYTGLFMAIMWLLYARKHSFAQAVKLIPAYLFTGVSIFVIGHIIAISLWPFGQEAPLSNWLVALEKSTSKDPSSSFFTYNHELFEGARMYMANVPIYYLPKFIFINSPLYVLIGFALILVLAFAWKKVFGKKLFYVGMILFVFVFPIAYAEYQSMYYYNGWRHYLFTYAPLVVLTALGWEMLFQLLRNKIVQYVLVATVVGLFALPASWMVKNHPNEVVYYNELVGGTKGAYGNYEMDYYSNSCRAAAEWIAKQEPNKKIVVAINNEPLTGAYWAQKINPNIQFQWVREYEEQKPFWDYAIFTSRTYSKNELMNGSYPPKGTVHTIDVDGVPIAVVVKRENYNMPLGYVAFESNRFDSAIYYFSKAVEWNPLDEEAHRMKGMAYAGVKSWDTALIETQKAIDVFPENYMAYSNMGLVYLQGKKDYGKALDYFKKANTYKFNYTDAYYYSAMAEYQRGDFRAGVKYLENATKRGGSGVPEIYYNLGYGYYNLQNYSKAEEALTQCLTVNPKMAMGYRLLAEVFTKQNKTQEAQFCMQKYQELGGR